MSLSACAGVPAGILEGDGGGSSSEKEEARGGEIQLSNRTDAWPSGVYNAMGVPEFTAAEVVYAYPEDETGYVCLNASREELIAYVDDLLSQGFHMADYNYENLQSHTWESFSLYFPNPGGQYSLECYYSWENDGAGTESYAYDEDYNEFSYTYNVRFCLENHGTAEGFTENGYLESAGIPDEALRLENADTIVASTGGGAYATDMLNVNFSIEFVFDYNLTHEFWRPYTANIIQACIDASDDGKALDIWGEPIDLKTAEEEGCASWTYLYNGKLLVAQVFCESGYGESYNLMILEAAQ